MTKLIQSTVRLLSYFLSAYLVFLLRRLYSDSAPNIDNNPTTRKSNMGEVLLFERSSRFRLLVVSLLLCWVISLVFCVRRFWLSFSISF